MNKSCPCWVSCYGGSCLTSWISYSRIRVTASPADYKSDYKEQASFLG